MRDTKMEDETMSDAKMKAYKMKAIEIISNKLKSSQMIANIKRIMIATIKATINTTIKATIDLKNKITESKAGIQSNQMVISINATEKRSFISSVNVLADASLAASASALVAVFCLFCIAGCSSDPMDSPELQSAEKVQMTLVTSGPQTRADYEGDSDVPSASDNKMHFSWRSGDQLSVYVDGVPADQNCNLGTKVKGKSAPFDGTVTPWEGTQKTIYAFYPYSTNGYAVTGSENSATATTSFTLPNPQTYTVGGAVSNSFMVGVGQAVTKGNAVTASASLKQVMSIIKLNIVNAPAKVTWVQLRCSEKVFPTTATVQLSDATISNPNSKLGYLAMVVNDGTVGTDKSVSFAMFPADLSGKTITVDVAFEGGKIKSIDKPGLSFERNTHYVMNFDASGAAIPEYYEVNGMKWASGNLVANGAHGAKIGAPTDGGLYFNYGSLLGWSGGANGDGTGGAKGSRYPLLIVNSEGYKGNNLWKHDWTGSTIALNTSTGTGDPCKYYLKGTWRLPTQDDYKILFNHSTTGWAGAPDWFLTPNQTYAVHRSGLQFMELGYRDCNEGVLVYFNEIGFYWSSSLAIPYGGLTVRFQKSLLWPSTVISADTGLPIRCVRD